MNSRRHVILFVDDEPWHNETLRLSLEGRGYDCISKTNATDAWTYLEKSPVDVLITDIMMPPGEHYPLVDSQEAGFHLIKEARNRFRNMSIICLSVISDAHKVEELKSQGVLYLRKAETPLYTALQVIESKATGIFHG